MIRTITDKKNIPSRITEVLATDHPRWLEKVLLLVGFYTPSKRAIRTLRVNGKRKIRTQMQKRSAGKARKASATLVPQAV